ncbi:hypothetical protein L5515_003008 [Caenorhabditis briggsae]|uniref:Protein-tyrosine-phosphatase n=1 Tax=Caenorhabditis briggsae TaxID=6238 RepID=A0AAE9JB95_CAEBR|nr:hypothetical protein L5515_003008 [Caenorhabditis briggsae]
MLLIIIFLFTSRVNCDESFGGPKFPRNASLEDPFPPLVENLQRLSRITNGLSLEIGLIDGSIPTDSALAELLHMTPLGPDDVININSEVLNAAIKITNLSTNLDSSNDLKGFEDRLVALEKMTEFAGEIGDFSKITYFEEYKASLVSAAKVQKSWVESWTVLKTPATALEPAFLPIFDDKQEITDNFAKELASVFDYAKIQIEKIEAVAKNFDDSQLDILESAKGVDTYARFIDILMAEREFRRVVNNKMAYTDEITNGIIQNFKMIKESAELSNTYATDLKPIQDLVESRNNIPKQTSDFTAGFPNGASDLEKLVKDVENAYILNRVKNGTKLSGSLKKAFNPYIDLGKGLKNVETVWKPLSGKVPSFVGPNAPGNIKEVSDLIDSLKACEEKVSGYPSVNTDEIEKLSKWVNKLRDRAALLGNFGGLKEFKDLDTLKEDMNTNGKDDAGKIELAKSTIAKWRADPKRRSLMRAVSSLSHHVDSSIQTIDSIPPLTKIDTSVVEAPYKIIKAQKNYIKIYGCLSNLKKDTNQVTEMIELVRKVRSQPPSTGGKIVTAVLESQEVLKQVQGTIKNIKNVKVPESLALVKPFPNSQEVSKKLGMPVRGLRAIQICKESREGLNRLFQKTDELKNHNNALSNDVSLLKKPFATLFAEIDVFMKSLEKIKGIRAKREVSDFKSAGEVFNAALKISDLNVDLKPIKEAIHALNIGTSQKYAAEEKVVEKLEALNLEFSKFGFTDALPALEALDSFFGSFGVTIASLPLVPSNPLISSNSSSNAVGGSQTAAESKTDVVMILIVIFVIIAALATIGAVIFCIYKKCWKKKPADVEKPSPKPDLSKTKFTTVNETEQPATPKPEGKPAPPPDAPGVKANPALQNQENPPEDQNRACPAPSNVAPGGKGDQAKQQAAAGPPNPNPPPVEIPDDDKNELGKTVCNQIASYEQNNNKTALEYCKTLYNGFEVDCTRFGENGNKKFPNQRWTVHSKFLPGTMAEITGFEETENFIDMNFITIGSRKWFMGQSPLCGRERRKVDTRPQFVAAIFMNKISKVLQLMEFACKKEGYNGYYPQKKTDEPITHGAYKVETTDVIEDFEGISKLYTLYKLTITHVESKKSHTLEVVKFTGWANDLYGPAHILLLLDFAGDDEKEKGNVLVHCNSGNGRTAVVVAVKYGIEFCKRQKVTDLKTVLCSIREARFGAFENHRQVLIVLLSIVDKMLKITSRKRDDIYFSIQFWRRRILDGCYHNFEDEKMKALKVKQSQKVAFLKKEKEKRIQYVALMVQNLEDGAEKIANYNIKDDPGGMIKREEQKKKKNKNKKDKRKNADLTFPIIEEPILEIFPEIDPPDTNPTEMKAPDGLSKSVIPPDVNAQDTSAPGASELQNVPVAVAAPVLQTTPTVEVANSSQPEAPAKNAA